MFATIPGKRTFAALEVDLPRIRSLGVNVVYLMPVHPISKKGSLGCPYLIADYRGINSEYGNRQDFQHFLKSAHGLRLKGMIDVALLVPVHFWKAAQAAMDNERIFSTPSNPCLTSLD